MHRVPAREFRASEISHVRWTAVGLLAALMISPVVATVQEIQATGTTEPRTPRLRPRHDRADDEMATPWRCRGREPRRPVGRGLQKRCSPRRPGVCRGSISAESKRIRFIDAPSFPDYTFPTQPRARIARDSTVGPSALISNNPRRNGQLSLMSLSSQFDGSTGASSLGRSVRRYH